jgi:hypothetical protein
MPAQQQRNERQCVKVSNTLNSQMTWLKRQQGTGVKAVPYLSILYGGIVLLLIAVIFVVVYITNYYD